MKKILVMLILVGSSAFAKSGNEVGNGGDVVICLSSKNIRSVELFDFFEFNNQHGEVIINRVGSKELIANSILTQLHAHDIKLATILQNRLSTFLNQTQFVPNGSLVNIEDSNNLITPIKKNCTIEQGAILKKKVLLNDKKFLINESLWDQLSETHKAGLMLHELIYEYFSDLGEKDSVNARALNTFLFSKKLALISTEEYWSFILSMKVPHYK